MVLGTRRMSFSVAWNLWVRELRPCYGDFSTSEGAGILFSVEMRAFRGLLRDVRKTGRSSVAVQSGDRHSNGRAWWVWASLEGPVG